MPLTIPRLTRRGARTPRNLIRISVLAAAGLTLFAGAGGATTQPPPDVSVRLTHHGPVLRGPTSWRPGPVRIAASSLLPDQEVTLLHLRPGYTYADFLADGRKAQAHGPAARAAIAHVLAHTVFDGGLDLFRGQSAGFTVEVEPGTYYLGEMTNRPELTPIHVAGRPVRRGVRPAATITATSRGFRVSGALPARGTVTFANESNRPHRLNLIPVEPGTTRARLLAFVRRHGDGPDSPQPPFALEGPQIGTADLSPAQRMQLSYRLPAGTYAAIDFDHNARAGRPEALEGMIAVVTVR